MYRLHTALFDVHTTLTIMQMSPLLPHSLRPMHRQCPRTTRYMMVHSLDASPRVGRAFDLGAFELLSSVKRCIALL